MKMEAEIGVATSHEMPKIDSYNLKVGRGREEFPTRASGEYGP